MENLSNTSEQKIMSYKEWALIVFISSLPLIGFIMLLVWAFGSEPDLNKKNWAKGTLLIALLGFILAMFILFMFGGLAMLGALSN